MTVIFKTWNTTLRHGETIIDPSGCKITKKSGRHITIEGDLSRIHIVDARGRVLRWPPGQARVDYTLSSSLP